MVSDGLSQDIYFKVFTKLHKGTLHMLKVQPTSSLLLYNILLPMQYNNPVPENLEGGNNPCESFTFSSDVLLANRASIAN